MKLSFLLIILMSALLLNGADESREISPNAPPVVRVEKHPVAPENVQASTQKKPEEPTSFQMQLIETLRAIAEQEKAANEQNDPNRKPIDWIQIGILVAAALYTFFAWGQWRAIRAGTDVSLRQANLLAQQQRPWVIVKPGDPVGWDFPPGGPGKTPFIVNIPWSAINEGNGPAFLVRVCRNVVIAPLPPPEVQPQYGESEPFPEMAIAPKGAYGSEIQISIDDPDFTEIILRRQCLMFYGFVEYYDALREQHRTRFCSYWYMTQLGYTALTGFMPVGPRSYIEYT